MSQTSHLVPLADVADAIVSGYLFRVSTMMKELELPAPAGVWFRVVVDPVALPLDGDQAFVVSPTFEVLLAFGSPVPGIAARLLEEAVATPGHVNIQPRVVFTETLGEGPRGIEGWRPTDLPVPPNWAERLQLPR